MLVHVTIVPLIQGGREQSEQGVKALWVRQMSWGSQAEDLHGIGMRSCSN